MGALPSHHEPLSGADLAREGPVGSQPHSSANVFTSYGRASIRKSLRRKSKRKKNKEAKKEEGDQVEGPSAAHTRKMDKLRKSFRESFRKRKESIPESSKPHLWQSDEAGVRAGTCQFPVKYRGCVEVFESRGMQVCEEALKVLRESRRRVTRGVLYVSGDGLRVVDDDTKGLIVDQTIEKVSFCAPDRNHERGFSYICRDGTTRRWMCHGFIAGKDSGERLSHAVGCAFAACLERKQKRDKQCDVTMTFDDNTSTFTRVGSFRQMSLTERLSDPQECKPIEVVPIKKVENPHAIERPHATQQCLQRQGSFRGFDHLNQFPFKRQLSLRLNELPSNLARQNKNNAMTDLPHTLLDNDTSQNLNNNGNGTAFDAGSSGVNAGFSDGLINVAPIPESETLHTNGDAGVDSVSAMCQQVSAGLSLLSTFSDAFTSPTERRETFAPLPNHPGERLNTMTTAPRSSPINQSNIYNPKHGNDVWRSNLNPTDMDDGDQLSPLASSAHSSDINATNILLSRGEEWLSQLNAPTQNQSQVSNNSTLFGASTSSTSNSGMLAGRRNPPLSQLRSVSLGGAPAPSSSLKYNFTPKSMQPSPIGDLSFNTQSPVSKVDLTIPFGTNSLAAPSLKTNTFTHSTASTIISPKSGLTDPFDAGWVSVESSENNLMQPSVGPVPVNPNNPFLNNTVTKAFQVQM